MQDPFDPQNADLDPAAPSFRDDCVMTWKADQEAEREGANVNRRAANAHYRRKLQQLARENLAIEIPGLVHPDDKGREYEFEGIRLGLDRGNLVAIQPCPFCGHDQPHLIYSRANLGAFLSHESSSYDHRCPETTRPCVTKAPSADEVFLSALRDWMNANVISSSP